MRKIFILCAFAGFLLSCSTTKNQVSETTSQESSRKLSEKDGSSYEKAIVINDKSEVSGIKAEYAWLKRTYPGYNPRGQSLNYYKKKPYDIITIVTADGMEKKVYFDISNFYGNF